MQSVSSKSCAIHPTRKEDFPQWYQEVIQAADMAENSPVRGCMVIKPWGYSIWQLIQRELDDQIRSRGVDPVYFPLFIPLSYLEKEAQHVEGFAKECAVITHHRLELEGDSLVPSGELAEPLVVRPTSEMIIGESFSRWVSSYRDLPMKINQWANVVRWEMRPRIFLRTTEFLWQEGHTVHASETQAHQEALEMLEVYRVLFEEFLAIPVIQGKKTEGEKFPGALYTYTLEAMMQDGKALQGCTSHHLGQNFSKAQHITFDSESGQQEYAWTTSWGCTTRTIGALIMVHGDDDGLRLPPKVAPDQVVILPVHAHKDERIMAACEDVAQRLRAQGVRVRLDARDLRGGEKKWEWIKKGVPIRIELGPKDLEQGFVSVMQRHLPHQERVAIALDEVSIRVPEMLEQIQQALFTQAHTFLHNSIETSITNMAELEAYFSKESPGFVQVAVRGDIEDKLKPLGLTARCVPFGHACVEGKRCIFTQEAAEYEVVIARSY